MLFEKTEVFNFEGAIRGMRNPLESWKKSDTRMVLTNKDNTWREEARIGENDLKLMQTLIKAGSEHRKFMRQIFVSVDITAPLYWWKEFDTYKVATVSNSCSTMHKLAETPITKDCFEMDDYSDVRFEEDDDSYGILNEQWDRTIYTCELLRCKYNELMENKKHLEEIKEFEEAKKAQVMAKKHWKELIRLLPESWLQKRTVTLNYENLLAMCSKGQRRFHKLTEWSNSFIKWARELPYAKELLFSDEQ